MFNDRTTPLSLLLSRRSGKPRDMVAPGPTAAELSDILRAAARVPDHGKLAPWRFVVVDDDQRSAFETMLVSAYRAEKPEAGRLEIEAMEKFARQGCALVSVLYSPKESHIPEWEQQLSAGAVCMQLLNAAHAMGYVGCWLTGWPTYSDAVRDAFGAAPERIAGFIYIGSPGRELEERPRPEMGNIISHWKG